MGGLWRCQGGGRLHPHLAQGCSTGWRVQHLPKKSQKCSWGVQETLLQVSTAPQDQDHIEHFLPPLLPLLGCSTPISLEMRQRSQIPEETAWHLFPMKSLQKAGRAANYFGYLCKVPTMCVVCPWPLLCFCPHSVRRVLLPTSTKGVSSWVVVVFVA